METHTLNVSVRGRDETQVERDVIYPVAMEFESALPGSQKYKVKLEDEWKDINVPTGNSYMVIVAKYIADDTANGIKKNDPAPFAFLINGLEEEGDSHAQKGVTVWTSAVSALKISTTYAEDIEVQVSFG